jgi:hypothetical protein
MRDALLLLNSKTTVYASFRATSRAAARLTASIEDLVQIQRWELCISCLAQNDVTPKRPVFEWLVF